MSPIWQLKHIGEQMDQQHFPKLSQANPQASHPHQLSMQVAIWHEGREQNMEVATFWTVVIVRKFI